MTADVERQTHRAATTVALAAPLGMAAVCWLIALRQMDGMDIGGSTELGSFALFVGTWLAMMAAMMLPGAVPAALRSAAASGRVAASPLFAGSYLAVWALFGLAVYALYRPHGASVAGAATIAAGVYELTPLKRACRRRCRDSVRSGFHFGMFCVGSSVGLMLVLVARGPMSVIWMAVVGAIVLAQKLLPPRAAIDVPLALGIVGLGIATVL
jgi:predicted metal-binding membrane protein